MLGFLPKMWFGNRFGGAEGPNFFSKTFAMAFNVQRAVSFLNIFEHIFPPRTCSTGLETGCKPVLLKRKQVFFFKKIWNFVS